VACGKGKITHEENEVDTMSKIDIYDFAFIKRAPETTEKQDLTDVIKIYFIENDSSLNSGYAIDIEENEAYVDPMIGSRGVRTGVDDPVHINNASDLIDTLEKYHVQDWETDYTVENSSDYEDGGSWQLWIQYTDGSVEKHGGSGTSYQKMTPENYSDFKKEFKASVEERIEK